MHGKITRRGLLAGAAVAGAGMALPAVLSRPARAQERPAGARMSLLDFATDAPRRNKAGDGYPTFYDGRNAAHHEDLAASGPGYDSTEYSATLALIVPQVCVCCGE